MSPTRFRCANSLATNWRCALKVPIPTRKLRIFVHKWGPRTLVGPFTHTRNERLNETVSSGTYKFFQNWLRVPVAGQKTVQVAGSSLQRLRVPKI